jgi:hypothetical protein
MNEFFRTEFLALEELKATIAAQKLAINNNKIGPGLFFTGWALLVAGTK